MARFLYINPDETSQARATTLGCGWMPSVPPEFASLAEAPCVILSGAGETIVIPDTKGVTAASVAKAWAPLVAAENQASQDAADAQANLPTFDHLVAAVAALAVATDQQTAVTDAAPSLADAIATQSDLPPA